MIPFDEIDGRLKKLGKTRAWLSEASNRKPDSIRVALAPSAPPAKRSELLQKALSDAIEREESKEEPKIIPPDHLTLVATASEIDAWCQAYKHSDFATLRDWAISELDKAAEEWKVRNFPQVANNEGIGGGGVK